MTLNELLGEYVATNTAITSAYTIKLLGGTCKLFSAYLGREALVDDLTDANLKGYIVHRQSQGKAPATIEREGCKLLTLWRFAAMHALVKPPTIRMARSSPHIPVAFLRHEIRRLFKAARRAKGEVGGVPNSIFFPALLGLIWDSGERVGAVRALSRSDIDCKTRWVTFKHRKGNGREMMKRMSRPTRRAMRKLLEVHQHETPFAHIHLTTCYFHLKSILRDADLPTDRRSMLHRLRRSHASYLKLAGGSAQDSLGHSSEAITVRSYYDPRVTGSRQPSTLLFNPFNWWDRFLGWFSF